MKRPAFRLRMIEADEAQVLSGVKNLLHVHPAIKWWTRVNSGKGYLLRVSYAEIRALIMAGHIKANQVTWIEFGAPGISDTIYQYKARYGGAFGAIEVKRPSGRVSDEQVAFLANVNEAGGVAGIARSVDDANRIITSGIRAPLELQAF